MHRPVASMTGPCVLGSSLFKYHPWIGRAIVRHRAVEYRDGAITCRARQREKKGSIESEAISVDLRGPRSTLAPAGPERPETMFEGMSETIYEGICPRAFASG